MKIRYCALCTGFVAEIKKGCKLKKYPKNKNFGQYAVCRNCVNQRVIDFKKIEKVKIYLPDGKIIERAMKVDEKDSDERD